MKKHLRLTVLLLSCASLFGLMSCSPSADQTQDEIIPTSSFTTVAPLLLDSVRTSMSGFGASLNQTDSLALVQSIKKMHRSSFLWIYTLDTSAAPHNDSLMWTATMSLKNFYQESMHQFCNEALRFNIQKEKSESETEAFAKRIAEEIAQEKFFYQNYMKHLPEEKQQPFKSVYAEAYAIYHRDFDAVSK